jgi:2-haloacid dehalogenase
MASSPWPLAGLRVTAGRLELRWPASGDLESLAVLAAHGVHDPGGQPFNPAWTDADPAELVRKTGAGRASAVVFDLGGVLLDWDPRYLYRKLFDGDDAAMERFLTDVCSPEWHAAHDLGRNVAQACRELAARHPDQAGLISAWAERSEEMVAGPIAGSVAILADLKRRGVPCYALSNMEAETFPRRLRRFGFLRWFDGHVISGLEGVAKPDPRIYRLLLRRYELPAAQVLFIDDRADNVAAARAAGMRALRFVSPPVLRAQLESLGLLDPGSQLDGSQTEPPAGDTRS